MRNFLYTILACSALAAPAVNAAGTDFMAGGGFGTISAGGVSASGLQLGAQFKFSDNAGFGLNYYDGGFISVSYRGYLDKYADGVFYEVGGSSVAGTMVLLGGAGFDIPLENKLTARAAAGIVVGDGGTAFAARAGVYYNF